MNNSESYNKWLEAAYQLFAQEGPKDLSIKALAELCGLPRTNFYYYFDNKNDLIDKVIDLHFRSTVEIFNTEVKKRLHCYIPDMYIILLDFQLGIQFTKQLFINREEAIYNKAYKKSIALSAGVIVPKFIAFENMSLPIEDAKLLWYTLNDTWYSRVNCNIFTLEYLCESYDELMNSIRPLIK